MLAVVAGRTDGAIGVPVTGTGLEVAEESKGGEEGEDYFIHIDSFLSKKKNPARLVRGLSGEDGYS
jgi:hypothetical protein